MKSPSNTVAVFVATVALAVLTACGSTDTGFTATTAHLEGPSYSVDVPQVDGGKSDARTEFDDGMRAEAQVFIRSAREDNKVKGFNSEVVRIGGHVLSGVLGIEVDDGYMHPETYKRTHVTNVDTGMAMTLRDLFIDPQQGLDVLSAQAATLIPKTRVGTNAYDAERAQPTEENYKTWVATPEGMRVYLGEIASHALGYIDITVPWSELDGLLKPGVRAVVSS